MTGPRDDATLAYDEAGEMHEGFARMLRAEDRPLAARIEAQRALIAFRASLAEFADPTPRDRPTAVCCATCMVYRSLPAEAKPPLAVESMR